MSVRSRISLALRSQHGGGRQGPWGGGGSAGRRRERACEKEMTAPKAGRAKEGWGTGRGARNNSSGSHPAEEARRRRFIIAGRQWRPRKRQPPGQAGSTPPLPGAAPLPFPRPYSGAAMRCNHSTPPSSSYCNNPGQAQLGVGERVFCQPLIGSQPSRARPRGRHHATSAQERGRLVGLRLSAPKAALARPLSADGSEGLEPPDFELPLGFRDVLRGLLCLLAGGRGEESPPAQPGCDPRKRRVALH